MHDARALAYSTNKKMMYHTEEKHRRVRRGRPSRPCVRGAPSFVVFEVLAVNGRDVRALPPGARSRRRVTRRGSGTDGTRAGPGRDAAEDED
jgi:hypothetical protein